MQLSRHLVVSTRNSVRLLLLSENRSLTLLCVYTHRPNIASCHCDVTYKLNSIQYTGTGEKTEWILVVASGMYKWKRSDPDQPISKSKKRLKSLWLIRGEGK